MLLFALLLADPSAWIAAQGGRAVTDPRGQIVEVSLGYAWVTDSDMDRLAELKSLRRLDLSLGQITERGTARLREMTSIRELTLFYSEFIADVALANIREWKQLERLTLRGTDITDTSLEYIGGMTNLKSLDISFTQVTNTGLDALGNLKQLEELFIGGNKITGQGLQVLRQMPRLRILNLNGLQKRNSGTWVASVTDFDLGLIGSLTALDELNLGGMKVTDLGTSRLRGLANLKTLDLSRTAVTAAGLATLPPVKRLNLWRSKKIGDDAAEALASMKSLTQLDLAETSITDRTLDALAALPSLQQLFVAGTAVTAAGVEKFRQLKPECQVSWQ